MVAGSVTLKCADEDERVQDIDVGSDGDAVSVIRLSVTLPLTRYSAELIKSTTTSCLCGGN